MTVTDLARREPSTVAVPEPAPSPQPRTNTLRLVLIGLSVAAFPLAYLVGLILNLTTA